MRIGSSDKNVLFDGGIYRFAHARNVCFFASGSRRSCCLLRLILKSEIK